MGAPLQHECQTPVATYDRTKHEYGIGVSEGIRTPDIQDHNLAL